MAVPARTLLLLAFALLAFAANSLLARQALATGAADAAAFTGLRLCAGALVLVLLARARPGPPASVWPRGLLGPLALFAYAWLFSLAYLRIGAGVGALVLFGSVQGTMLGTGLLRGERPGPGAWLGLLLAAGGLVWLLLPSAGRPDAVGFAQMALAGVAWGVYSLHGRRSGEPLLANARSFVGCVPLALACLALAPGARQLSVHGAWLALVSGAVTSGLGYAVWYRVLPRLSVTQAAVAQLSVPVLAALGGVAWLGEALTLRLCVATALVLGGVGLALASRR